MKTDEEIEALEREVAELKAECLRWSERWEAHITGAFRAMEERAEMAEAKLREAVEELRATNERAYAARGERLRAWDALRALARRAKAWMERAEKAERELKEARARLEMASRALHEAAVWRNNPAHASDWRNCTDVGCVKDRAALGEQS